MKFYRSLPNLFFFILLGLSLLGPFVAPSDPSQSRLSETLRPPDGAHWLGTDENGRDILSRLLYGARLSLGIGVTVVTLSSVFGIAVGLLAGFKGGWADKMFVGIADIMQAFPGILLSIALAAFLPPSIFNVILLLSFTGWVSYARVARAQTLVTRGHEYVQAAQSLGLSTPRVLIRHIFPNIFGPLLVQASFGMAAVILTESTLSFLGLGVPVSYPTWGRMLDSGSALLLVAPHLSLFPGLMIMLSVLTFNLLGDKYRERYSR